MGMIARDFSLQEQNRESSPPTFSLSRKLATYIFTIKNATRMEIEGFEQVGVVMLSFYKNLLGQTHFQRQPIDLDTLTQRLVLSPEQQIDLCKPSMTRALKRLCFPSLIINLQARV